MFTDVLQKDFLNEKSKSIITKLNKEFPGTEFCHKLSNGINVIFIKDKYEPLTKFIILHQTGSKDEQIRKKGLAHLYEHLAFSAKNGEEHRTFYDLVTDISASINGGTTFGHLFFYAEFPPQNIEKYFELEALRLGKVGKCITQEDITTEIEIIRNECNRKRSDDPLEGIESAIKKSLYKETDPKFYPTLGVYNDLKNVSVEDIADFENRNLNPENCYLVILGDYKPKILFNLLEHHFGGWSAPSSQIKKNTDNPAVSSESFTHPKKEQHFYYRDDRIERGLVICYKAPDELSKDWILLQMALKYLQSNKVIYRYTCFGDTSNSIFTINDYNKPTADSYSLYQIKLNNIIKENISDSDFEEMKRAVLNELLTEISLQRKMFLMTKLHILTGETTYSKMIDWIKKAQKKNVRSVIKKWIIDKNQVTLLLLRENDNNFIFPDSKEIEIDKSWLIPHTPHSHKPEVRGNAKIDYSIRKLPELNEKYIPIWKTSLKNGIKVYGSTIKRSRNITGSIMIMLDRSTEPERLSGINIYCAGILKKPKGIPFDSFKERLVKLNSQLKIITLQSWIEIKYSTDRENIKKFFELMAQSLMNPGVSDKAIKSITKEQDYKEATDSSIFSSNAFETFKSLIFGADNCYSRLNRGRKKDRRNINSHTLKSYLQKNITPDIVRITVSGNIKKQELEESVLPLEKWKGKHIFRLQQIKNNSSEPGKIYYCDTPREESVKISLYRLSPPSNTREWYILLLANDLLGQTSEKNLIFRNLRLQNGLSYSASSSFWSSGRFRYFCAEASSNLSNAAKALKILTETVFTYPDNFTEEMFRYTLRDEINRRNTQYMTTDRQSRILLATAEFHPIFHLDSFRISILKTLTYEEIIQTMHQFFNPEQFYTIITGDKARLEEQIKNM